MSSVKIALRIWFLTSIAYFIAAVAISLVNQSSYFISLVILPLSLLITLPAFLGLWFTFSFIAWIRIMSIQAWLVYGFLCSSIVLVYGTLNIAFLNELLGYDFAIDFNIKLLWSCSYLSFCVAIASLFSIKFLQQRFHQSSIKNNNMEQNNLNSSETLEASTTNPPIIAAKSSAGNSTLIKAIIMAIMVVVLLIPTLFITNLVDEREKRQATVVQEVSSKWASDQTIGIPFIHLLYSEVVNIENSKKTITKDLFLLPQELNVQGDLQPEVRPRSIYKVYLYKSHLTAKGNFLPNIPSDIPIENIDFSNAKLCFLLNDIKGIDEKLSAQFNGVSYDFAPGLPFNASINKWVDAPKLVSMENRVENTQSTTTRLEGLSVSIPFTKEMLGKVVEFSMQANINGSDNLRFLPLAANSKFRLESKWSNPKFDGNKVPSERTINDSGFSAVWNFNSANLPFGTAIKEFVIQPATYAFGVSMVQPADHYSKINRCIKYAILFIGLSFALFFIIELMQKNPLHPVQYLLVGVALLVFFTLLLSISEFLLFDYSYAIAALATVLLISLYAKAHFKKASIALVFGSFIGGLYTFIFVLIRLEDTALLVGSIGLFVILSIAMYASRKINWYANSNS